MLLLWVSFTFTQRGSCAYSTLTFIGPSHYIEQTALPSFMLGLRQYGLTRQVMAVCGPENSRTGAAPGCYPALVFLIILGRDESIANSILLASSVKRGFLGLMPGSMNHLAFATLPYSPSSNTDGQHAISAPPRTRGSRRTSPVRALVEGAGPRLAPGVTTST